MKKSLTDFLDIKGEVVCVVAIVSWDKKPRFSQHYEEDLREQFVIADPRERERNDC